MPTSFEWVVTLILPLALTFLSFILLSEAGSATYFRQWFLYMLLDATYGHLFHIILLVPARWIASRLLPGSIVPPLSDEKRLSEQEEQSNDLTITWPSSDVISKLPQDWVVHDVSSGSEKDGSETIDVASTQKLHSSNKKNRSTKNKSKTSSSASNQNNTNLLSEKSSKSNENTQPYYLNHARGSTRIRQASQRIGAAMGTLFSSYLLCSFSSLVTLDDIGLGIFSAKRVLFDVTCGFVIGSSIVIFIFLLELRMGWIKIIGTFETVVPEEIFAVNFAWDVLFHVGVSINEEVMLRGWMFILGCHGLLLSTFEMFDDPSYGAAFAIAMSIILQATLFSLLHIQSPGATAISLLNLFLGGIAASLNVLVTGGTLWLGIGWHFGWNIFMGHILGRSTSGIPMSCAMISVLPIPKPGYEKYHGGTFGPEQGVLAPLAYILGMVMVILVYGWEELAEWRERLVIDLSNIQR